MKSNIILGTLIPCAFLFNVPYTFGQFDAIKKRLGEKVEKALSGKGNGVLDNAVSMFEKKQPISTTFDDAIYEADILGDFEPKEDEYQPLDIQPKAENGAYRLQSGLYSMNAKSFCLKGYTYGPSRGDGHLYAPLKGKKAGFVQTIIERYGQKPETPQQDVQVLLWAIIAGADMNTLGTQHAKTLNTLFSTQELLTYKGKDWLSGVAEKEVFNLKQTLLGKVSPQLEKLIEADNKIKSMVRENKTFQEIEKIAVIAGVAPRDMVREVSKGRWSYHPNGYFVRFFPNGYSRTRVDVYVPFNDAVQTDSKGKAVALNNDARQPKEVIFNPSTMVASPANRPSQRIGVTPVPVNPTKENFELIFYAYSAGQKIPTSKINPTLHTTLSGHMYIGFAKNGQIEKVKGLSPEVDGEGGEVKEQTEESHLLGYHTHCFAVKVSPQKYYEALNTTMGDYFLGTNDCVSYAAKIAKLANLVTPKFSDTMVFPYEYIIFLIQNNQMVGTTSHRLCSTKPINQTPIPSTSDAKSVKNQNNTGQKN